MEFKRKDIEQATVVTKAVLDKALKDLINSNSSDEIEKCFDTCFNQLFAIRDICKYKLDCE